MPVKKVKQISTRGGAREGSGRPALFAEATTTLTVRVPESQKENIKALIKKHLKKQLV
jgi:hypothetical protein